MHRVSMETGLAERSKVAAQTLCAAEAATLRNTRPSGHPDGRSFPFGAPPCRIYQPSASVMQSGRRRKRSWVLEFEPKSPRWIEPLMGWTASEDPFAQIRLTFPNLATAVDYAERHGLDYLVVDSPGRRVGRRQNAKVSPEPERTGGQAHLAGPPHHDWLELMIMQR
jgi:NADH dehydrogenase